MERRPAQGSRSVARSQFDRAMVHIALAWSYIEEVDAGLLDEIGRVIATLIRLIV